MKFGPGKWIENLLDDAETEAIGLEHTLAAYGEDASNAVLQKAQGWVSSFTVAIGTTGKVTSEIAPQEMNPGSGVIVRVRANLYGILTAAHVLNRHGNTKDTAGVTVVAGTRDWDHGGELRRLEIAPRPNTVDGFDNETEQGPDIAIIPLTSGEWRRLNDWGMVAYNLDKRRWSAEDRVVIRGMKPCVISIIHGVRCAASQFLTDHRGGEKLTLAMTTTNTQVQAAGERKGYDYVRLPSEISEASCPTNWKNGLTQKEAAEIDELYEEGVTKRVWGGASGAGVWNVAVATNSSGFPNGRVFAELAGICFFANPEQGCIIAHGPESLRRIALKHAEKEALRFHRKAQPSYPQGSPQ